MSDTSQQTALKEMGENLKIPMNAIRVIQEVIAEGDSKGHIGWWKKPITYHLNRLRNHADDYRYGVEGDEVSIEAHARHMLCRAAFIVELIERAKQDGNDA